MKYLSVILATFITVLTVQSTVQLISGFAAQEETCCSDSCCESDNSCSRDSDPEKQNAGDCCPGGVCNPFEACYCCCGGIVGRPSIALITSFVKINFSIPTQNDPVLGFRSDCYHPPEVI